MSNPIEGLTRRRLISAGLTGGMVGVTGCSQRLINIGNSTTKEEPIPTEEQFRFDYSPDTKQVKITYLGGTKVLAGLIWIQSTEGTKVNWPQLGSTSTSGDTALEAGDTAIIGKEILNWTDEVGQSETIRLIYQKDSAPTTVARFSPPKTTTTKERSPEPSGNWPMFQYDDRNTGYIPDAGGPGEDITALWTTQIGGEVSASPVAHRNTIYIGSHDGILYAIDASSGEIREEFEIGGDIYRSAVIDEKRVFITNSQGYIHAINHDFHERAWEQNIGRSAIGLTIKGDHLYASRSGYGQIIGLNKSDGQIDWRFEAEGGISSNIENAPAVADGKVVSGSNNSYVYAIDRSSGSEIWTFDAGDEGVRTESPGARIQGDATISAETVYVGSNAGRIHAINLTDGSHEWHFNTSAKVSSSPAVANGILYAGNRDGTLYALDAESGKQIWTYTADGALFSPIVTDDRIYVGSQGRKVYCLNLNGERRWSYTTDGRVTVSPIIVDGILYIADRNGKVYALTDK